MLEVSGKIYTVRVFAFLALWSRRDGIPECVWERVGVSGMDPIVVSVFLRSQSTGKMV
jgi:hypothetical protein